MAAEAELERLIVRLVGDATVYQTMLQQAAQATSQTASSVEKDLTRIEKFQLGLQKLGLQAIQFGAAMNSAFGAGMQRLRDEGLKGFAEAEAAEFRLNAVLNANGRQVRSVMEDYKKFAAELQKTTTAEDDAVVAALALAEGMGLTGDAAKKAVKEAQGLAAMKGGDLQQWIQMTAMLGKGSIGRLSRVLGMGEDVEGASSAEKLAEAHKKLATFIAVAESEVSTYSGQVKQMNNEVGNAKEVIGKFVADGWKPFNVVTIQLARAFQELDPAIHGVVASTLALGANAGTVVTSFGQTALGINSVITLYGTLKESMAGVTKAQMAMTAGAWALKGALVAGVAYGAYQVTSYLTGGTKAYNDLNDAMKESVQLQGLLTKRQTEGTSQILAGASGLSADEAKQGYLSKEIEKAKLEAAGYATGVANAEGQVDELNTLWKSTVGHKGLEVAKVTLKEQQELLDGAKERVTKLQEAYKGVSPEALSAKVAGTLNEFLKQQQERSLFAGASEMSKALQGLRNAGVSEEMIAIARAAYMEADALEKSVRQRKELNDELIREQEEQVGVWNDQLAEGQRIAESLFTPTEKLAAEQKKLKELLEAEAITPEVYAKAMEKARKEAAGVDKHIQSATTAMATFGRLAYGSAAHLAELENISIWKTSTAQPRAAVDPFNAMLNTFKQSLTPQSPKLFSPKEMQSWDENSPLAEPLNRLVALAEQYWGNGTNVTLEPAGLS